MTVGELADWLQRYQRDRQIYFFDPCEAKRFRGLKYSDLAISAPSLEK